ncbi:hypothetical protein ABT063_45380 [Streptomyces sp. NPDC002838]|uniref:hypothetical protein n=1 Tax=Streptomyces sp. NPDC002838 TaxID=3154436 RepID=UPI00331E9B31
MTPSSIRGRPRRAASHICVRVALAVLGGAVGVAWLVLPGMTISTDTPVAIHGAGPTASASAAAQEDEETSAADLVLPLVVVAAAVALAGYGYIRRTRRARTRTTPGGTLAAPPAGWTPPLTDLDDQSRAFLTEADDWIRTSREELGFAEARFGAEAAAPFTQAVQAAESELTAAFRIRRQYEAGVPTDETSRRQALTGIVGRCQESGRRLDAEAPAFDQLRALEREIDEALTVAEERFRDLTGRTATTEATLTNLARLYAPSATAPVTGYFEQAKDRLLFATVHLNQARQKADLDDAEEAAGHLRAAEGGIAQAAVFVDGIDRLAAELRFAAELVPAALTGAEAELWEVRGVLPAAEEWAQPADAGMGAVAGAVPEAGPGAVPDSALLGIPVGELRSRVLHADAVLASVRQELTGGRPYDPLAVLSRVVEALAPATTGRSGALPAAARLTAGSATAAADAFITTHRGEVGADARIRFAAANQDLLDATTLTDLVRAHTLARHAHDLAEQDVRVHGTPIAGRPEHALANGAGGAVAGGVLLSGGRPASFGGPRTRNRRNFLLR